MKKLAITLLMIITMALPVYAFPAASTVIEIRDSRQYLVKTFEITSEDDSSELIESPIELDGFTYTYMDMKEEVIPHDETLEHTETIELETEGNDISEILSLLVPEMDYSNENGFSGKLHLDHGSVSTEIAGYTSNTVYLSDSRTVVGLEHNDTSGIAKTVVKSGITLSLKDVEWRVQESDAVDYSSIPSRYTATAHYSGSYTQKVPTGYITKAIYKGEIVKKGISDITCTLTYLGEEIPLPEPTPAPPEPEEPKTISPIKNLAIPLLILTIAATAGLFLWVYSRNVVIYKKEEEGHTLLAHRHLSNKNLVVDISKLTLYEGDELAVLVKERIAKKIFGRQIRTLLGSNEEVKCIADKQIGDFWYSIKAPKGIAE